MTTDDTNKAGRLPARSPAPKNDDTDHDSTQPTDSGPGPLFDRAAPTSRREPASNTARALKGQSAAILAHLQTGARINQPRAIELFQCYRLGARIWDLKQAGYDIQDETVGRMAEYFLVSDAG